MTARASDEGVPVPAASALRLALASNIHRTQLDEAAIASAMTTGNEELRRRHGDNAAQIIADAQTVFARFDKRNPAICDWLCATGAANDPYVIETLARLQRVFYAK